jgi:hypothetical protein
MVMNSRQEISLLRAQNARLEAEVNKLKQLVEAKLSPPAPQPQTPPKPPAWAQQSQFTGVAYSGPPSVPQRADNGGPVGIAVDAKTGHRKFPDGLVRDQFGEVVPHSIANATEIRPVLQSRSPAHEMAVELLDRIVETTPVKE